MKLTRDDWETVRLSDVCETSSGGTPSRSRYDFYNGSILWVKSGELHSKYVTHSEEKITELGLRHSSAKLFPVNTVLVAMYGVTAGTSAILKCVAATNQAVCGIVADEEKMYYEFLYNTLTFKKNSLFRKRVGTYQLNISQNIIRNIEILLPPLETQKQIASLFQFVEIAIGQVVEQEKRLKDLALLMISSLTSENPSLGNLIDPKTLVNKTLGDIAYDYSKREDKPRESEYTRYVGSDSINRFDFKVERWQSTKEIISAMKVFEDKDYLLVRRSLYASDFRERAPRADFNGLCSGDILTIKENNSLIHDGYLLIVLNSPRLWEYIVANASGSITRRVKWKDLAVFKILIPDLESQKTIVKLFGDIQDSLEKIKHQRINLNALKQQLLNDLLG